jgi:Ribbon-helix-helix protein, copG family
MHAPQESSTAVQVRLTDSEFDSLENWRRAQEKIPPRSEVLREAIRRLVTPPIGAWPMSNTAP